LKVAIVCSWLNQYGGAERVLEVIHAMYPQAPVYTSILWPQALPAAYREWDIRPSFLNRLPFIHRHHQWFLLFYPYAFRSFDLSQYDLVLSVTSAFAHGVVTGHQTLHICYCLTPARFLWDYHTYVAREGFRFAQWVLPPFVGQLRRWDRATASRVDHFVAISETVRQRINQSYGREAAVIYPPVDARRFQPAPRSAPEAQPGETGRRSVRPSQATEHGDYFLIISRLVPYKRIDLAVRAFSQLGLPLWIIGQGRDRRALEAMAGPNVRFLGRLTDEESRGYLERCRAFVFPGEEDFGIAPLEAQAAGRPVIAYARGGALETILEGKTGLFFREPTAQSLAEAVLGFHDGQFDPSVIREHALRFDRAVFQQRFGDFIRGKCTAACREGRRRGVVAEPPK
jgi:glycosyltransferase involved in cell wall biosynthesis